jgi:hypothetical protein
VNQESFEILSAFVDGEPVDPGALTDALMAPGGREALVDFARLRADIGADDSRPSPGFYREIERRLGVKRLQAWTSWPVLRRAAAVVVLGLAGLGINDLVTRLRDGRSDEPPRATRVLRFTPGVDWKEEIPAATQRRSLAP